MNFTPNQIKPSRGYALVKPAKAENKTESGIYLPENDNEIPQHGVIISLGATPLKLKKDYSMNEILDGLRDGVTIIFKQWTGSEVDLNGDKYQLVKFEDILALVSKEEK